MNPFDQADVQHKSIEFFSPFMFYFAAILCLNKVETILLFVYMFGTLKSISLWWVCIQF